MAVVSKIIMGIVGTACGLGAGFFLFFAGAMFMTGDDLKDSSNMTAYLVMIAIVLALTLAGIYMVWARLFGLPPFRR